MKEGESADRGDDRSADFLGIKFDPESEISMNLRLVWVGAFFLAAGVLWGIIAQQFEWQKLSMECAKLDIPHLEPFDQKAACACAVPEAKKEYTFIEFIHLRGDRSHNGPESSKAKTVVTDAVFTCVRHSRLSNE